MALVVAPSVDSVVAAAGRALYLHHGTTANFLPDSTPDQRNQYPHRRDRNVRPRGLPRAAPDVTLIADPHCTQIVPDVDPPKIVYPRGRCVWTNADCSFCTPPMNGNETVLRWLDPGQTPPPPTLRITPLGRRVRIDWDNRTEILMNAGLAGTTRFVGYRVYKLVDWRDRSSTLPPRQDWALFGAYTTDPGDTLNGEQPLGAITDSTLDWFEILYEQEHYPVGRYHLEDREVKNGFDYAYAVSVVSEQTYRVGAFDRPVRYESPLVATTDQIVTPHEDARDDAASVWWSPTRLRASAAWDRPAVLHDAITHHIDFSWDCRARAARSRSGPSPATWSPRSSTTAAAATGRAPWNLVSRNGQDCESGLYLFTVDSPTRSPDRPLRGDPVKTLARLAVAALVLLGPVRCSPKKTAATAPDTRLPPQIASTHPAARSRDVPVETEIWAEFAEPLDSLTVDARNVALKLDTQFIPATVTWRRPRGASASARASSCSSRGRTPCASKPASRPPRARRSISRTSGSSRRGASRTLRDPYPPDRTTGESPFTALSWDASTGAPSALVIYEIYINEDSAAVAERRPRPFAQTHRPNRRAALRVGFGTRWWASR